MFVFEAIKNQNVIKTRPNGCNILTFGNLRLGDFIMQIKPKVND